MSIQNVSGSATVEGIQEKLTSEKLRKKKKGFFNHASRRKKMIHLLRKGGKGRVSIGHEARVCL